MAGSGVEKGVALLPGQRFTDYSKIHIEDEPEKRNPLAFGRVILLLLVVVGASVGGVLYSRHATDVVLQSKITYFAPYVDVTNTPEYQFQDPTQDPAGQVALGFVVADGNTCAPSWGGAYSLDAAGQTLGLDRRIFTYENSGGDPIVSFGGRSNQELATVCQSVSSLKAAYSSVLTRYHMNTVDFDIEGDALNNADANQRRALAVASLQAQYRSQKRPLAVWLTLPVAEDGLQENAASVIRSMLQRHVALAGVNVMTMDLPNGSVSTSAVEGSLTAAESQLADLYRQFGYRLSTRQVWAKLGATPMIGQNDISGEVFDLSSARALVGFAKNHGLGRVSMWSLNRDSNCGSSFTIQGVDSTTCSGVNETQLAYAKIFQSLHGSAASQAHVPASSPLLITSKDLAGHQPFPLWQGTVTYPPSYYVVWQGNVYQSKWTNQEANPALPVQYTWQSPWQLIGPILPSDKTPVTTTVPAGTYPEWDPTVTYTQGAEVLYDGEPYQAKWYNSAVSPAAEPADPSSSPWLPLFALQGEPAGTGNL